MRDRLARYRRWRQVVVSLPQRLIDRVTSHQQQFWHNPMIGHPRIDVASHRRRRWPTRQRQQELLVAAAALAVIGLGTATTGTINGDEVSRPGAGAATAEAAGDPSDRTAAAQRPDRAERDQPTPAGQPATQGPGEDAAQGPGARAAAPERKQAPPPKWAHPMPGAATTSCFGARGGVLHAGVDLAAPPGTPIHAVAGGTVIAAGWSFPGYGISVVIDHGNGYYTHYAHASETTVAVGDTVKPGDVIAREGSTGDSTGPHLHFEVHKDWMWNQVEPAQWLRNRDIGVGC